MNIRKKKKRRKCNIDFRLDGGSGAGVTINPVAFLVINKETIKLMPIDHTSTFDRIADYIPDVLSKFCEVCKKDKEDRRDEENKTDNEQDDYVQTTIKAEVVKHDEDDYLEDE